MSTSQQLILPGLKSVQQAYELGSSATASDAYEVTEIGTFKDSLRAPVHRWFRYPAGYSYRFVNKSFDLFGIIPGDWVYDPFSGSGTTLICAKQRGINGYGVEAHSFVHWVADVKLYWEFDLDELGRRCEEIIAGCRRFITRKVEKQDIEGVFPALVYKCYHPQDLKVLYLIREYLTSEVNEPRTLDLLKLALTDTLRSAAAAGIGWPYISPRKNNGDKPPKGALTIFASTVRLMCQDIKAVRAAMRGVPICDIRNVLGDSRNRQNLEDNQVKLALTSPPYLNNYDYADRTRLETYFWGISKSWGDITRDYRDKLLVAATTQISRSQYNVQNALSPEIEQISPQIYNKLQNAVFRLSELRLQKGGKKDYDLMVALYFNGIFQVLKETYRVLMKGGRFCLVLGDSAPYGVHIQTDQMIGELGLALGFSRYDYHELRKRGDKWRDNPQRHDVKLREGIVILIK